MKRTLSERSSLTTYRWLAFVLFLLVKLLTRFPIQFMMLFAGINNVLRLSEAANNHSFDGGIELRNPMLDMVANPGKLFSEVIRVANHVTTHNVFQQSGIEYAGNETKPADWLTIQPQAPIEKQRGQLVEDDYYDLDRQGNTLRAACGDAGVKVYTMTKNPFSLRLENIVNTGRKVVGLASNGRWLATAEGAQGVTIWRLDNTAMVEVARYQSVWPALSVVWNGTTLFVAADVYGLRNLHFNEARTELTEGGPLLTTGVVKDLVMLNQDLLLADGPAGARRVQRQSDGLKSVSLLKESGWPEVNQVWIDEDYVMLRIAPNQLAQIQQSHVLDATANAPVPHSITDENAETGNVRHLYSDMVIYQHGDDLKLKERETTGYGLRHIKPPIKLGVSFADELAELNIIAADNKVIFFRIENNLPHVVAELVAPSVYSAAIHSERQQLIVGAEAGTTVFTLSSNNQWQTTATFPGLRGFQVIVVEDVVFVNTEKRVERIDLNTLISNTLLERAEGPEDPVINREWRSIALQDQFLFISDSVDRIVFVYQLHGELKPTLVTKINLIFFARYLQIYKGHLFVIDSAFGIRVYDITNLDDIKAIALLPHEEPIRFHILDDMLYIEKGWQVKDKYIQVVKLGEDWQETLLGLVKAEVGLPHQPLTNRRVYLNRDLTLQWRPQAVPFQLDSLPFYREVEGIGSFAVTIDIAQENGKIFTYEMGLFSSYVRVFDIDENAKFQEQNRQSVLNSGLLEFAVELGKDPVLILARDHLFSANGDGINVFKFDGNASFQFLINYDGFTSTWFIQFPTLFYASGGLGIYNIEDFNSIHSTGQLSLSGLQDRVQVRDNVAFLLHEINDVTQFSLINVTHRHNPTLLASVELPGAVAMVLNYPIVIVPAGFSTPFTLYIVDVSEPSRPTVLNQIAMEFAVQKAVVHQDKLITFGFNGNDYIDTIGTVNDNPFELLNQVLSGKWEDNCCIYLWDFRDPIHPLPIASWDSPGDAFGLIMQGNQAVIADGFSGLVRADFTSLLARINPFTNKVTQLVYDEKKDQLVAILSDKAVGIYQQDNLSLERVISFEQPVWSCVNLMKQVWCSQSHQFLRLSDQAAFSHSRPLAKIIVSDGEWLVTQHSGAWLGVYRSVDGNLAKQFEIPTSGVVAQYDKLALQYPVLVVSLEKGMQIYDLSREEGSRLVSYIPTTTGSSALLIEKNWLFQGDPTRGLVVYDISKPESVIQLTIFPYTEFPIHRMQYQQGLLFITAGPEISIINADRIDNLQRLTIQRLSNPINDLVSTGGQIILALDVGLEKWQPVNRAKTWISEVHVFGTRPLDDTKAHSFTFFSRNPNNASDAVYSPFDVVGYHPPQATLPWPRQNAQVGVRYCDVLSWLEHFTHPDELTLTFSVENLPITGWLEYRAQQNALCGVASRDDIGLNRLVTVATDNNGHRATSNYEITVASSLRVTSLGAASTYQEDTYAVLPPIQITTVSADDVKVTFLLSNREAGLLPLLSDQPGQYHLVGTAGFINQRFQDGIKFNLTENFDQDFSVRVTVSDGINPEVQGNLYFTGQGENDPPTLKSEQSEVTKTLDDRLIYFVQADAICTDIDSRNLQVRVRDKNDQALPSFCQFSSTSSRLSCDLKEEGTLIFNIYCYDSEFETQQPHRLLVKVQPKEAIIGVGDIFTGLGIFVSVLLFLLLVFTHMKARKKLKNQVKKIRNVRLLDASSISFNFQEITAILNNMGTNVVSVKACLDRVLVSQLSLTTIPAYLRAINSLLSNEIIHVISAVSQQKNKEENYLALLPKAEILALLIDWLALGNAKHHRVMSQERRLKMLLKIQNACKAVDSNGVIGQLLILKLKLAIVGLSSVMDQDSLWQLLKRLPQRKLGILMDSFHFKPRYWHERRLALLYYFIYQPVSLALKEIARSQEKHEKNELILTTILTAYGVLLNRDDLTRAQRATVEEKLYSLKGHRKLAISYEASSLMKGLFAENNNRADRHGITKSLASKKDRRCYPTSNLIYSGVVFHKPKAPASSLHALPLAIAAQRNSR